MKSKLNYKIQYTSLQKLITAKKKKKKKADAISHVQQDLLLGSISKYKGRHEGIP
jgi:hypothetical protein